MVIHRKNLASWAHLEAIRTNDRIALVVHGNYGPISYHFQDKQ